MIKKFVLKLRSLIVPASVSISDGSKIKIFADDVFLVSYPKSGNTWLRFLIGNYLTGNQCDFKNSHLIVPDIHFNPEQCSQIRRPRFIKSHMPFTPNYSKVVYLVRDGRDVAVSYYFHLMKYRKITKETKFEDFLIDFNAGYIDGYTSWSSHVNSWLNKASDYFIVVRYEDLKANTLVKLIQILDFAGVPINQDAAIAAVDVSRFEKMKFTEKSQHKLFEKLANSDPSISFVRSGQVGDWKNFFTDELMNDFINIHGSALKSMAYL